jgi:hypothetical protein
MRYACDTLEYIMESMHKQYIYTLFVPNNICISSLFCHVTQHRLVVVYRRFGANYRPHFHSTRTAWILNMGPTVCVEMSVTNQQSPLRNITEERVYHLHSGVILKSRAS